MEFTGERYVPSVDGQIKYEHLHRYALCLEFVVGKSVLDIASGEGYGSALLAKVAESVVGVDIDNESVEYAKVEYIECKNLKFLVGSCEAIPILDDSIDVVISFETIEHHDKHEEMMQEIKRVLKPGGLLIISSPNRLKYSDEPNYSNPFHVKELYYDELADLLSQYFSYFRIYGQRLATSSFVFSLEDTCETSMKSYTGDVNNLNQQVCSLNSPIYFVAICSDDADKVQIDIDSIYVDKYDDLLKALQLSWQQKTETLLQSSQTQLQQPITALEDAQFQLQQKQIELERLESQLEQTQTLLEHSQSQIQEIQLELQSFQSQQQQVYTELSQLQLQQKQIQIKFENAVDTIKAMETSKFWKLRTVWFEVKRLCYLSWMTLTKEGFYSFILKTNQKFRKKAQLSPKANIPDQNLISKLENVETISLNTSSHPLVSIIIPVFNQSIYTFNCLKSLKSISGIEYEVIVVDDASTDDTQEVLAKISGVKVVKNLENLGFIRSCNRGAAESKAEFICFLNNDTKVLPNWMDSLLEVIRFDKTVGVVGSKLIYPDGRLQEAGGIIWKDASGWNYGRFDSPDKPEYNYVREVDYCSGASLLVKAELFKKIGGFSEEFLPAYYEDTDLCFSIRQLGYKVLYQPKSQLIHFEGISSGTDITSGVKKHQESNRKKFQLKRQEELTKHFTADTNNVNNGARRHSHSPTILVIDSYVPLYDQESGSCRLYNIVKIFKSLGYSVIFLPDNGCIQEPYGSQLQALGIEVLYSTYELPDLKSQLVDRLPIIDIAWICRPDLCEKYINLIKQNQKIKLIYDTVDLHFLRLKREEELLGKKNNQTFWENIQNKEIKLAKLVETTIVVSDVEKEILASYDVNNVNVIPNIHNIYTDLLTPFEQRSNLLFIGGYNHPPNVDAVVWLCQEIMPLVWKYYPEIQVTLLGSNPPSKVKDLQNHRVKVTGYIQNVEPYFLNHRVFVAPLRYGAGMKGKIGQSLSYGLPVVTTSIGAEGIGLTHALDVMIANESENIAQHIITLYNDMYIWNNISHGALEIVKQYSSQVVAGRLSDVIKNL
jgi:GT2 family glycosyltransferase/ubiquinone/menaquinone biosynthesis C-methylase UbiE